MEDRRPAAKITGITYNNVYFAKQINLNLPVS